ncbi:response regulator [Candidatus Latescibacterota bacterium]
MGAVILVVEDNEKNMRLIGDLLGASGYTILKAVNGREGVEMAKEKKPDLILMDIQMPVMDGLEATKLLKSDESVKHIPVIALTSYAMKGDEERMLGAGFDGYMSKPFNVAEFLKKVVEYLK